MIGGFAFGWSRAKRRGGDRWDKVHYATIHAIALGLAAFALIILLQRMS